MFPGIVRPLAFVSALLGAAICLAPALVAAQDSSGAGRGSEAAAVTVAATVADAAPVPIAPEVISRDEAGRTTVRATRLEGRLVLDGRLDDEAYLRVRSFGDFTQQEPHEGRPATVKTDVWLLFDEDTLYISARCWQDPSLRMVANELRRDAQNVFDNDSFAVVLDTFRDRRNGVTFQTNPLGVIVDQQMTDEGAGLNRDWNAVWQVRTSRDAEGWSVEMALPFKSLRFPPGRQQVWGINLRRNLQARSEYAFLSPVPASAGRRALMRVSRAATLVGIEIGKPVRQFEVKPFLTSMVSTDREALPPTRNDMDTRVGLDLKMGLGHGLSADVTLYTDFAQVEEDEAQVNLSRFSLYLPEKREFFLEGQGLFSFGGVPAGRQGGGPAPIAPAIFFSRRVGLADDEPVQILAGARVTGRVGPWSLGAIQIRQDDSPRTELALPVTDFTVVRVRRDLMRRGSVGLIYTRRAPSEAAASYNQVGGVDMLFAPSDTLTVNTYVARSDTAGRGGDDLSYRARIDYNADLYGFEAEHLVVGDDFDPDAGLLRREDFQRDFVEARVSRRPAGSRWLKKWNLSGAIDYITDNDRVLESREQQASLRLEFTNGDGARVEVQQSHEVLDEAFDLTDDHSIPIGVYDFEQVEASYDLGPRHRVTGNVGAKAGRFYDGTLREARYRGRVELSPALSLEPNLAVNRVERSAEAFWVNVLGMRVNWALSPRAVASTLVQYSSGSSSVTGSARLRWEYRPGSDLFLVYSEGRDTLDGRTPLLNRSLALKVSRLIRF